MIASVVDFSGEVVTRVVCAGRKISEGTSVCREGERSHAIHGCGHSMHIPRNFWVIMQTKSRYRPKLAQEMPQFHHFFIVE